MAEHRLTQQTPDSLACMPDMYEGDIDGFIEHVVAEHRVPSDYLDRYRRAIDQGSWEFVYNLHKAIMQGRYVPRHRRSVPPDWDGIIVPLEYLISGPRHSA